jgi:uncharacterized protein involved in exopolysaccharide biosynthesis
MQDKSASLIFVYKQRKFLILTFLLGAFLAVGVTFFIPKRFLSTAIVYPVNSHTKDDIVANPQFGYEIETEQLLQLLQSKNMRQRTIEKFDLISYYEMDTSKKDWSAKLDLKYIKDVQFSRTQYLSIVINVITESPELSAKIANFQVKEVNAYRDAVFSHNRLQEFNSVKKDLEQCELNRKLLKDSIYKIKGGENDLLFNFIENLNNEDYDASEFVNDSRLEGLIEKYVFEAKKLAELQSTFSKLQIQINKPIPEIYTIDQAVPSYKKVSPSYLVNSLIGGFTLLFLSITILIVKKEWNILKVTAENDKSVN